ncbi:MULTISPECIES: DNA polymerase III subunit delta [unclassified Beijerinckia]|uniref:DNA polymerase III subunit delta n=1 Tax=unclassified Beijerinckia TaxID=2638183 RepID=UPI00089D8F15|nr:MULTISPECIES: DNA polymerase III subunit delta [unclassified Beijerinckia]MDH7798006.1 DNA polymerase-3 subunit delta [Beijerinckia sp. GAS462]SED05729.1 DNA polymerase III, delta subunit [Beijerinckia sp. 28-YEA-48]
MVAIRSSEADRLLASRQEHIRFYLFFGADTGLISERARKALRLSVDDPKDPFQVVEMTSEELASDPQRLLDEANTVGLFGGKRAVFIGSGSGNIAPAFEPLFDVPPVDSTVIVEAGALRSDSALRKLFTQHRQAVAIECNPDREEDLVRLIDAEVARAQMKIDPDAKELLVSLLGADRLTTRSEIDKLLLYAHEKGVVDLDAVLQSCADASALVIDEAIDGAFAGNHAAVSETLERVFAAGNDPGGFLIQALRHAVIAHRARLEIDSGTPADRAVETATRIMPVPFPRRAPLSVHARQWSAPKLARAVTTLGDAIRRSRLEAHLAPEIATRALWSIALAGRNPGR